MELKLIEAEIVRNVLNGEIAWLRKTIADAPEGVRDELQVLHNARQDMVESLAEAVDGTTVIIPEEVRAMASRYVEAEPPGEVTIEPATGATEGDG